jgi:nicotinamide riboside kinase
MVISFTGSHSTGKSTLLKHCQQHFDKRFKYVEEVTRLVKRKYKVPINEHGDDTTQCLIINQHIINSVKYKENVIMDRCIIDGIVYTSWLAKNGQVGKWVEDYAFNVGKILSPKIDVIFQCIPDFELVKDGERSESVAFRDEINDMMNHILEQEQFKNKTIKLHGNVEQRMQIIKDTIK